MVDRDEDGVVDEKDQCPDEWGTPEHFGCSGSTELDDFVFVQGGKFEMGCTPEQGNDCIGNEANPPLYTTVKSFYISKYEITNEDFCAFLNVKGNQIEEGSSWLDIEDKDCQIIKNRSTYVPVSGYAQHPVVELSWYGANAYAKWKGGRLPSEEEWEYAARGGIKSKNYKFAGRNSLDKVGWSSVNSESKAHKVGLKKANELGIYDMSGNVWEWCADWYDSNKQTKVLRGGAWGFSQSYCRVATRFRYAPLNSNNYYGFRIILDYNQ